MTEYAIEIERMTVRLENLFIEGCSLEPTLMEYLRYFIKALQLHGHEIGLFLKNVSVHQRQAFFNRFAQNTPIGIIGFNEL